MNNIHALIYQGDIIPQHTKFKNYSKLIYTSEPNLQNDTNHPKRKGIAVQYFYHSTPLLLIDGNHRAIHSRNSFFYNFKIELLSQSDLSVFCFDSYIDFISYHWITSKQHLAQLDNAGDIEYFLNFLEAFLQENQNNMFHGLLNPYTANE